MHVPVIKVVDFSLAHLVDIRGMLSLLGLDEVGFGGSSILDHVASPILNGGEGPNVGTGGVIDINLRGEGVSVLFIGSTDGSDHKVAPIVGVVRGPSKGPGVGFFHGVIAIQGRPLIPGFSGKPGTAVPKGVLFGSEDVNIASARVKGRNSGRSREEEDVGESRFQRDHPIRFDSIYLLKANLGLLLLVSVVFSLVITETCLKEPLVLVYAWFYV